MIFYRFMMIFLFYSSVCAMQQSPSSTVFFAHREDCTKEITQHVFGQEAFWSADGSEIICHTSYTNSKGETVSGHRMKATPLTSDTRDDVETMGRFTIGEFKKGSTHHAVFKYEHNHETKKTEVYAPSFSLLDNKEVRIPHDLPLDPEYHITHISCSPDKNHIAAIVQNNDSEETFFKVFSRKTDSLFVEKKTFFHGKHLKKSIRSFNWDYSSTVLLALYDRKIFVFEGCTGALHFKLKCPPHTSTAYWSPNSHTILTATKFPAGSTAMKAAVYVWDLTKKLAIEKEAVK